MQVRVELNIRIFNTHTLNEAIRLARIESLHSVWTICSETPRYPAGETEDDENDQLRFAWWISAIWSGSWLCTDVTMSKNQSLCVSYSDGEPEVLQPAVRHPHQADSRCVSISGGDVRCLDNSEKVMARCWSINFPQHLSRLVLGVEVKRELKLTCIKALILGYSLSSVPLQVLRCLFTQSWNKDYNL